MAAGGALRPVAPTRGPAALARGARARGTAARSQRNPGSGGDAALVSILEGVRGGATSVEEAAARLREYASGVVQVGDFARLDSWRAERTGAPEVVWGPGKTPEQIVAILEKLRWGTRRATPAAAQPRRRLAPPPPDPAAARARSERERVALATRISPEVYEELRARNPAIGYEAAARVATLAARDPAGCRPVRRLPGTLALVSAGTADHAVAEECRVVAEACGCRVARVSDVGVAGLHRLLARVDDLRAADVVVVVAGMDGALPSVVTGLVEAPVIACPTSVGYGAALGGLAPMLSSLNSCAAGLTVVNVDNGFGGGYAAAQINRTQAPM